VAVYLETFSSTSSPPKDPLAAYQLSAKNRAIDARTGSELLGTLDRDITDLTILIEPAERPHPGTKAAPTDFFRLLPLRHDEATTRPVAGVPPDSVNAP
jgi:hypothetical protein